MNDTRATTPRPRRTRLGVRGMITAVGAAGMAAAVTVGAFAIAGLSSAGEARDHVSELGQATSHAQEMEYFNADVSGWQTAYAWDARRIGGAAAVQPDNANRAGFLDISEELRAELDQMPVGILTNDEQALYDQIAADWDTFFTLDAQVSGLYAQNTPASVDAADALILGDSYEVYFGIIELTHQLKASLEERTAQAGIAAAESQASTTRTMVAVVVLGALLVLGVALAVVRRIVRPLAAVTAVATALAAGDLTRRSGVDQGDEVGRMAASLDQAQESLRSVLSSVAVSSDAVAASSEELSA
ncbi:HAMP domain-containing protein, partial [Modestobacter marinus]|uniref:HAMP domain-containing protein n=1 Tax=Modestobacter marinus TaxID=477641 RepID=UPI001C94603B